MFGARLPPPAIQASLLHQVLPTLPHSEAQTEAKCEQQAQPGALRKGIGSWAPGELYSDLTKN